MRIFHPFARVDPFPQQLFLNQNARRIAKARRDAARTQFQESSRNRHTQVTRPPFLQCNAPLHSPSKTSTDRQDRHPPWLKPFVAIGRETRSPRRSPSRAKAG